MDDILEHVISFEGAKAYNVEQEEMVEEEGVRIAVRPCHFDLDGDPEDRMGVIVETEVGDMLYYHTFDVEEIRKVVEYVDAHPKGILYE